MIKRILFLLALIATTAPLLAQDIGQPNFPQILPAGTVVGRRATSPGPTEAIPIASLAGNSNFLPVLNALNYAGADESLRIRTAILSTDCPTTGCTVDARGLTGAQTFSVDMFGLSTKPVSVLLGVGTYTVNLGQNFQTGDKLIGSGQTLTTVRIGAPGVYGPLALASSATDIELSNFTMDHPSNTGGGIAAINGIGHNARVYVHDIRFTIGSDTGTASVIQMQEGATFSKFNNLFMQAGPLIHCLELHNATTSYDGYNQITNIVIHDCAFGVRFLHANKNTVTNVMAYAEGVNTSLEGFNIEASQDNVFAALAAHDRGDNGFVEFFTEPDTVHSKNNHIVGGSFWHNCLGGVYTTGDHSTYDGIHVYDNGQCFPNQTLHDGVLVDNNGTSSGEFGVATHVTFHGLVSYDDQGSPTQYAGLQIVAGTVDTTVTGFRGYGNGTAAVIDAQITGDTVTWEGESGIIVNYPGIWQFVQPVLIPNPSSGNGSLQFNGHTSGNTIITAQDTASGTLTLPASTGTLADSASSPLALSATTGALTCTTCVTSSGGGAITGTAPVAVSAAGAVSITGSTGKVLAGSGPAFTATPTLGLSGTTGTLSLVGSSSGTAVITPQAAAGTPTLTLGTSSGTPVVTASAPLAINSTTGNATVTGAAGQVLAGATPAFTATPTLGASGTLGSLTLGNATSGTVTLQPVAGALGTPTISLPTTTGTLASSATTPLSINATTGVIALAGGNLPATATNDSASAGNVGEIMTSSVASGSPVALTSTVAANVTSISLTAGDWDCTGTIFFIDGGTTTFSLIDADINATTATLATQPGTGARVTMEDLGQVAPHPSVALGPARFSLASSGSAFLVIRVTFAVSTTGAYGFERCRRVR